jgi:sigma-B regulation protein RsbU (phosphoserine phosphatase)
MDSAGNVFVSVALPGQTGLSGDLPSRWLVAIGDVIGKGEPASRLKDLMESEIARLAGNMTDPASILTALDHDLVDLAVSERFACLLVAVIDNDRHDLTVANAGHVSPFLRHADRRIDYVAEEVVPTPGYEKLVLPTGPGEILIFYSDGVTSIIDNQCNLFGPNRLLQAITQAPGGAASVGQSILEAIRRLRNGRAQQQDITLLCLGRLGPTTGFNG